MLRGNKLLFDRSSGDATHFLRRTSVAVDWGRQWFVTTVGTVVCVSGLAIQTRTMSVAIHALFTANPAIVEITVGSMVLNQWGFLDHGVFRKQRFVYGIGVVLKVFYWARSRGIQDGFPFGFFSNGRVTFHVAARLGAADREGLQVLRSHAAGRPQLYGIPSFFLIRQPIHSPPPTLAYFDHSPVGHRSLSLLCFTIQRQLPSASLFIPTVRKDLC